MPDPHYLRGKARASGAFTYFDDARFSIGAGQPTNAPNGWTHYDTTADTYYVRIAGAWEPLPSNLDEILSAFNGAVVETIDITVAEDTGSVELQLQKDGGGDLTFIFGGAFYTLDCTPAAEVTLTAGTDASPTLNYVYVTESGGTLTLAAATLGFPITAHAPIATVLVQSAASLATDGAYKVHAWTDHLYKSTENGHVSHLNAKLRQLQATWTSGCTPEDLISSGGAEYFETSSGSVYQLHPHTMPARNMESGDPAWVVNDPDAAYTRIADLDAVDKLSDGTAIANNRYVNLVVWGVVSEKEADCKLMINLPDAQYTVEADAQVDDQASADYTIPGNFTGTGFLIARYTLQWNSSTGWSQSIITDLRGLVPSTSVGGSGSAALALNDLSDVVISSPVAGHLVQYDGAEWNNVDEDTVWQSAFESLTAANELAVTNAAGTLLTPAILTNQLVGRDGAGTIGGISNANVREMLNIDPDAKGDLIAGTGDNTVQNLTIGSNYEVLEADSAETPGMLWRIHHPRFQGIMSGTQNFGGVAIQIDWDATPTHDEGSAYTHSTSTNPDEITIDETGEYEITCEISLNANNVGAASLTLEEDTGGGFAAITNAVRYMSISTAGGRHDLRIGPFAHHFDSGDKLRVTLARYGAGNFTTVSGSNHILIKQNRRA